MNLNSHRRGFRARGRMLAASEFPQVMATSPRGEISKASPCGLVTFEKLNLALMGYRFFARGEGAKVAAFARAWIDLARVEPVLP